MLVCRELQCVQHQWPESRFWNRFGTGL